MDFMILDGIQKLHSPLLDTLFVCITRLGDKGFVWCLMALVFLLIPEKRKTGFICVAALLLTEITRKSHFKALICQGTPLRCKSGCTASYCESRWIFISLRTYVCFLCGSVCFAFQGEKESGSTGSSTGSIDRFFKNVSLCTLSDGYCRRYSLGNTDGICLCTGCRQDKIQEKFNKHRKKMTLFYVSPVIIMKISANLSAEH